MKKKVTKRVSKVIKNRNAGHWSEATFWQFIRNSLRRRSMVWKPITLCRERAKRAYKGPLKRQKFEYQCNICKNWFKATEIAVDHINGVGSLTCSSDLPHFVETLFCEIDNLQVLCLVCHKEKTDKENTILKAKK